MFQLILSPIVGALMDKEGETTKDIQHRLSKARQTFYRMRRTWGTSEISRKTKVQFFKTIVRSVLINTRDLHLFVRKCWMSSLLRLSKKVSVEHMQRILRNRLNGIVCVVCFR